MRRHPFRFYRPWFGSRGGGGENQQTGGKGKAVFHDWSLSDAASVSYSLNKRQAAHNLDLSRRTHYLKSMIIRAQLTLIRSLKGNPVTGF